MYLTWLCIRSFSLPNFDRSIIDNLHRPIVCARLPDDRAVVELAVDFSKSIGVSAGCQKLASFALERGKLTERDRFFDVVDKEIRLLREVRSGVSFTQFEELSFSHWVCFGEVRIMGIEPILKAFALPIHSAISGSCDRVNDRLYLF